MGAVLLRLGGRIEELRGNGDPFLAAVSLSRLPPAARERRVLLTDSLEVDTAGYSAIGVTSNAPLPRLDMPVFRVPDWLHYLHEHDVLRVHASRKQVRVLYRHASKHNALLVTERCNSDCIMCSQPPKAANDGCLVEELIDLVRMIPQTGGPLGITGGEPLLAGHDFYRLLTTIKAEHPNSPLQVLTNGRLAAYGSVAKAMAAASPRRTMFCIPLYSHSPETHDFVVQAHDAWNQTMRGILNFKRYRLGVEIRIVMHRFTVGELEAFGEFIYRNLSFVDHVAFMGLEGTGHTRMHPDALWVEPASYADQLLRVVPKLVRRGVSASIYNTPLCVLDRSLWPFAVASISDWKHGYVEECEHCLLRASCGGVFTSGLGLHSAAIRRIEADELHS